MTRTTYCFLLFVLLYTCIDIICAIQILAENAPLKPDTQLSLIITKNKDHPPQSALDLNRQGKKQNTRSSVLRDQYRSSKPRQGYHLFVPQGNYKKISRDSKDSDVFFGQWSRWSKCSRNCQQSRRRKCQLFQLCKGAVMKERHPCWRGKCRKSHVEVHNNEFLASPVFHLVDNKTFPANRLVLKYNIGFYSEWSSWSDCSEKCLTSRKRICKFPWLCGRAVVQEEAFCNNVASICESRSTLNSNESNNSSVSSQDGINMSTAASLSRKKLWDKKKFHSESFSKEKSSRNRSQTKYRVDKADLERKRTDIFARKTNVLRVGRPHVLPENCGRNGFSKAAHSLRILGGMESPHGKWPWQVAIMNQYQEVFCGGTLISSQWVLTAAHCVKKHMHLRIAEHDLSSKDQNEIDLQVNKTIIHPLYDPMTVDNDVALLRLPRPMTFNEEIAPACLPSLGTHPVAGTLCTILGWGKLRHVHQSGSRLLNEAKIPVVPEHMCRKVYHDYYITNNMFCAGFRKGFIDSCAGDSGGPLLCQHNDQWYVHGVTSFGEGCGRRGKYGIYSKVENYKMWINDVIAAYTPVQTPLYNTHLQKQRKPIRFRARQRKKYRKSSTSGMDHSNRRSINIY